MKAHVWQNDDPRRPTTFKVCTICECVGYEDEEYEIQVWRPSVFGGLQPAGNDCDLEMVIRLISQ